MRGAVVLGVILALTVAAVAIALVDPVNLTLEPKGIGEGSEVTTDLKMHKGPGGEFRGLVLRLGRGFKFDRRAVARRCKVARAAQTSSCPAGSRIGGGRARLTLTPSGEATADLDLYLAPRQHPGDLAGIVVIADLAGRKGHAVGRLFRLDPNTFEKYGMQATIDPLRGAFKPPPDIEAEANHVNLHFGTHRTVDGQRHDLIRNPGTCGAAGWPWQVLLIHPGGDRNHHYGAVDCFPAPTP